MDSKAKNTQVEVTPTNNDEKGKNFTVSIKLDGRDKYDVERSVTDFENLLSNLKKCNGDFNSIKIPQKKLFKGSSDLMKQRQSIFNEIIQKIITSESLLSEEFVQAFFNIPSVSDTNTNDENNINLGEKQNLKAKPTDFEFLKVIGKGSFGQVYLAKHIQENKYYAVKVLLKRYIVKRNETRHIMAEKSILVKNCSHPFLVSLHYSFQTKEKLYFVLTYVNGGELFYHLQREKSFSESRLLTNHLHFECYVGIDRVKFYAAEISLAISHLHSMNIIYRDLKPENILLGKDGHIVLTDFGLGKEDIGDGDKTTTFCGTPEYLAPEILLKKPYDKNVDWWCLGCVIYELLFGLPPFYSKDTQQMYNAIVNQPLQFKLRVSDVTRSILEGLLCKNSNKRLGASVDDFEEIKTHPFFGSINWVDLLAKKVNPPFIPDVAGESDTKNVDVEFTREPIPESLARNEADHSTNAYDGAFQGFTYVPGNEDH